MKASELRLVTEKNRADQELNMEKFLEQIFERAKEEAERGRSETIIDLRTVTASLTSANFQRAIDKLKEDGYDVNYRASRTPGGMRELELRW